jgi:DNA primase small subunit
MDQAMNIPTFASGRFPTSSDSYTCIVCTISQLTEREAILPSVIEEKFAQYYRNNINNIGSPCFIEQREFGFILLRGKIMLRHKRFEDFNALEGFLTSVAPSDAYYSAAYYEHPEAEMNEKHWLGADLVFDIDADHVPAPCRKIHDHWICRRCRLAGKGPSPEMCPECGGARFDSKTWACEKCIESAKSETIKLTSMLLEDFGFSEDAVKVYFSGHRGYHVHVDDKSIHNLDSMARKEIVDYVIGLGLKAKLQRAVNNRRILLAPDVEGGGWKRRIGFGIHKLMTESTLSEMDRLSLSKPALKRLRETKEILQTSGESKWINVRESEKSWEEIIDFVVSQQSSGIDTVVTTDIHRLIRLNGSLHGKTGLMKVEVPLAGLIESDPLKDAVAFKTGTLVVDIVEAPRFRLGDAFYGPYKNDSYVELPAAVALFLLCKNAAKVVKDSV